MLGASGGLGLLLVQLALRARVVAVARDTRKLERMRSVAPGASVVDPERRDWIEQARSRRSGSGRRGLFDNIGSSLGESAIELVADGGHFSAHSTPSGPFSNIDAEQAHRREVTITGIETVQPDPDALRLATDLALAGGRSRRVRAGDRPNLPARPSRRRAHSDRSAHSVRQDPADHVSAACRRTRVAVDLPVGQVFGA